MPQYNAYIQPKKYGNLRRRRKIAVFFAAMISAAVFISSGVYLIFYSPVFEIKNFRLVCENDGADCRRENEEELKNNLNLFFSQTFFLNFKKNKLLLFKNADLEKFISESAPKIYLRDVKKEFLTRTLEINYSERKMAGIYCSVSLVKNGISDEINLVESGPSGETDLSADEAETAAPAAKELEEIGPCFYIDETGTAYEEAPQSSGSLIILIKDYPPAAEAPAEIKLGAKAVGREILETIFRLRRLFQENLNTDISEIKLNSAGKNSIEIGTKNGWSAIFNAEDGVEGAFTAMRTILEEEIKEKQNELEYIDLRFGTKVYYKFKNSE